MASGLRRRARVYALQVLYALDVNEQRTVEEALEEVWRTFELEIDPEALAFARALVEQTTEKRPIIDDAVQSASRNWRLDRMSWVDRNILRLATYELRFCEEVPVKVIINEAVELAKRFGTAESPAFVNGILDRIAQSLRKE